MGLRRRIQRFATKVVLRHWSTQSIGKFLNWCIYSHSPLYLDNLHPDWGHTRMWRDVPEAALSSMPCESRCEECVAPSRFHWL